MLTTEEIKDPNQILIMHKTFEHIDYFGCNGMKKPSHFIINIWKIGLNVFKSTFETIKSESELINKMMKITIEKLNKQNISLEHLECKEHVIYIIKLLFTTRICKECKWSKEKYFQTSSFPTMKQQPKLRILQHK